MSPLVIRTRNKTIPFTLNRDGASIIHARLSVWSQVGTPTQKRVHILFFEDALDGRETFRRDLDPGNYFCVLQVFIREDLNGTFEYLHLAAEQPVHAVTRGDVNTGGAEGEGALFRHEYILAVTA